MLELPRYLLGVAEIAWLTGFAALGGFALRGRVLPSLDGPPAHLATGVLALALLIGSAEALGALGLFEPVPYLLVLGVAGTALWQRLGGRRARPARPLALSRASLVALGVAGAALIKFGLDVEPKLTTGMTGFDSTWYHGPFAAGFLQSANTWELQFIAPQFLAWFYPANAEIFHGVGMLAFGRDLLSPLLNLGWLAGCLVACWCIGRPYGTATWSLALGAVALSLPVLSDQAGEARNDIVGIFFLLAAVAVASNAWAARSEEAGLGASALAVSGLAAGLAAGTKLNFLLPVAVFAIGLTTLAPAGARWRALGVATLAALGGGGYWYLRNLVQSGNPLPWFTDVGPLTVPGPDQALGGREGHSVLGYLADGTIWSEWFLPGLSDGLTVLWPLLLLLALGSLVLAVAAFRQRGPGRVLAVAGLVGLAAVLAWLIAPTSASGPDGMPRGFESGLRYLAPALVLGFVLLPTTLAARFRGVGLGQPPNGQILKSPVFADRRLPGRGMSQARPAVLLPVAVVLIVAVAIGYPVQRHYLENRYADPSFAAPGLNAAFRWAQGITDSRIATTATRQYPLFGPDLSNRVQFVGEPRPDGGFVAPASCRQYRRLLNRGHYDYVIASRDRLEPSKPPYPPSADWTGGPHAKVVLRKPPTVIFKLSGSLSPSACS